MTPAPRVVVPEPARRSTRTGRFLYSHSRPRTSSPNLRYLSVQGQAVIGRMAAQVGHTWAQGDRAV